MEFLGISKRFNHREAIGLLVVAMMMVNPVFSSAAPGQTITEAQLSDLHAALVLKIAMFVEWPDNAPELPDGKISLGVVGDDHVFLAFDRMADKKIKGQELELFHHQGEEPWPNSRILFLSRDQFFDGQSRSGVLTIGDSPSFNTQGGMIKLSLEDGRPRFSINLKAAEAAGIGFSSKLLKIATIYEEEIQ